MDVGLIFFFTEGNMGLNWGDDIWAKFWHTCQDIFSKAGVGYMRGNNSKKELVTDFVVDYERCWMPFLVIFTFYHVGIIVS